MDTHFAPTTFPPANELPRRVRQASLVPQLRERPGPRTAPARVQDRGERSPEQARARMKSFLDGWVRGGGRPPGGDHSEGDPR